MKEYRVRNTQGYVFDNKVVTITSYATGFGKKVAICQDVEHKGEFHLILTEWLHEIPARCECCGQVLPEEQ
jgi:hypothetical protein